MSGSPHLAKLEESLPFHRREWAFQRAGWALVGAFLIAAGLGLLGPGGLSRAAAGGPDFRIAYDRFGRREADLDFQATCRPSAAGTDLRLAFSAECLRDAEIRWMRPEPDSSVAAEDGGVAYVFRREPGAGRIVITWSAKPEFAGRRACRIATGGNEARFRQWIWP